jgi:hypothetical protein
MMCQQGFLGVARASHQIAAGHGNGVSLWSTGGYMVSFKPSNDGAPFEPRPQSARAEIVNPFLERTRGHFVFDGLRLDFEPRGKLFDREIFFLKLHTAIRWAFLDCDSGSGTTEMVRF